MFMEYILVNIKIDKECSVNYLSVKVFHNWHKKYNVTDQFIYPPSWRARHVPTASQSYLSFKIIYHDCRHISVQI